MPCKQCGECCKLPSGKYCKYIIKISPTKRICRIYRTRKLGQNIGEGCVCMTEKQHDRWLHKCEHIKEDN